MPDVCIYRQYNFKAWKHYSGRYFITDYHHSIQIGPFDSEEEADKKIRELEGIDIISIPPR